MEPDRDESDPMKDMALLLDTVLENSESKYHKSVW
jgi:hypothetical protein